TINIAMKIIDIPEFGQLDISHIVCDYNGTLAVDGELLPGVSDAINSIEGVQVHVITADTFGIAKMQLKHTNCLFTIAPVSNQAQWKLDYIESLGADSTATIGNGRNDSLMLKRAALGIALLQKEGAAVEAIINADIVCSSILDALDYFSHPKRLIATLRS
ncbi:MAG: HAD family hydrolase, partial [Desulforhopalus sp.]